MRVRYWKRLFNKIWGSMTISPPQSVVTKTLFLAIVLFGAFHLMTYISKFEIKLVERQDNDDTMLVEYEYIEEDEEDKANHKLDNLEYDALNNVELEQVQYNYRYRYMANKKSRPVHTITKKEPQIYPNVTRVCSMPERLEHLRKYCERDKTVDDTFQHRDLLVDEKHRILYCAVPRVASTSWRTVFAKATGKVANDISWPPVHSKTFMNSLDLKFLGEFAKPDANRIAREFYKVLVVRHPYDRLVSAWRDRLVVRNSPSRWTLGMAILAEYRDEKRYELSRQWNDTARFFEFVDYLSDKSPDDDEWNTFVDICDVCMYSWNAILRVETSYNDSYHILKRLPKYNGDLPFLHSHLGSISEIHSIQKPLPEMNYISSKALEYMRTRYEADFSIFGYEWNAEENRTRCAIQTSNGECC